MTVESERKDGTDEITRTFTATVHRKPVNYARDLYDRVIAHRDPTANRWDTETITLLSRKAPKFDAAGQNIGNAVMVETEDADVLHYGVKSGENRWTVIYIGSIQNTGYLTNAEFADLEAEENYTVLL